MSALIICWTEPIIKGFKNSKFFGGVIVDNKKYISIIFDDGPREPMREMVDKFIKNGSRCGFAVIGNKINSSTEEVLKYAIENGFELVSHGQNHIALPELSKAEIKAELLTPINEIENRFGYKIRSARAPFLWADEAVFEVCKELNLPLLGQGITVAHDWEDSVSAEEIYDSFIKNIYDGAIITLHVKPHTCEALDKIFAFLNKENYALLTPSDLFKVKNVNPIPFNKQITRI